MNCGRFLMYRVVRLVVSRQIIHDLVKFLNFWSTLEAHRSYLYFDSPYTTVADIKEIENKENLTKLNYD